MRAASGEATCTAAAPRLTETRWPTEPPPVTQRGRRRGSRAAGRPCAAGSALCRPRPGLAPLALPLLLPLPRAPGWLRRRPDGRLSPASGRRHTLHNERQVLQQTQVSQYHAAVRLVRGRQCLKASWHRRPSRRTLSRCRARKAAALLLAVPVQSTSQARSMLPDTGGAVSARRSAAARRRSMSHGQAPQVTTLTAAAPVLTLVARGGEPQCFASVSEAASGTNSSIAADRTPVATASQSM